MPTTFAPPDHEFATSSGANVNFTDSWSYFDHPPNSTSSLTITSNTGDSDPGRFETGETYDLTWAGLGGGGMEDATIIRSDYLGPGQGAIVFEGINSVSGELFQVVWSPGFDLESWYWDNGGGPSSPNAFWTGDQDARQFQHVCFARGTLIATPRGQRRIEDLRPGDKVTTLDNGAQQILWMGSKTVLGVGASAPLVIQPGVLDNERALAVSPQHRIMIRSAQAEIHFGQPEVWVPAKSLIGGAGIRVQNQREVTYYHLLLSGHEVLIAERQPAESLFLGDMARSVLAPGGMSAVAQFFPNLTVAPGAAGMTSARMMLKLPEARLLAHAMGITGPASHQRAPGQGIAAA